MAFTYTFKRNDFMGQGVISGIWQAAGVTSGNMTTGFKEIHHVGVSAGTGTYPVVTYAGGTVKLTCADGDYGSFQIYGQ